MKTYILDLPNRLNRISENLDVKSVLCNKSWVVFNETGEKELYIFQENGDLIISLNGVVTSAAWQYISANKTILIKGKEQSYMLHPSFYDNVLFVLSLDGKKESCMFLIDENNRDSFIPKSLGDIQSHLLEPHVDSHQINCRIQEKSTYTNMSLKDRLVYGKISKREGAEYIIRCILYILSCFF